MAKSISSSPFKAMEDEAYHAFREWPIFLIMRQKELEIHLAPKSTVGAPPDQTVVAATDSQAGNETEIAQHE